MHIDNLDIYRTIYIYVYIYIYMYRLICLNRNSPAQQRWSLFVIDVDSVVVSILLICVLVFVIFFSASK